jgi:hypothetical protein
LGVEDISVVAVAAEVESGVEKVGEIYENNFGPFMCVFSGLVLRHVSASGLPPNAALYRNTVLTIEYAVLSFLLI